MMIVTGGVRLAALGLLLASGAAIAETKMGAEIGANGGYATSPFGAGGRGSGEAGTGTASGTVRPTVSFLSPTGQIVLTGQVTHTEYFRRYDATTDYSVSSQMRKQLSEVTSVSGTASFTSSVRNALFPVLDPSVPPGDPAGPIAVDPAAAENFARRTKTVSGNLSLDTRLSARDSITVSARGALLRFSQALAFTSDYDSYGGAISYRRAIGENSSIGVSMDVSKMAYDDVDFGNSTQYSPAALLRLELAPRISLDLSAGVTISEFDRLTGGSSQTSFSGTGNLCREGDRSQFCLQASRRVSPSTISGASNVLSFGANYGYSFSERSGMRASVSYSKARALQDAAALLPGVAGRDYDYLFGTVSYDHRLMERLSAVVSLSYSDSFNQIVTARGSNFSGTVGIRYRLGEL
jgi:hypothetical protein